MNITKIIWWLAVVFWMAFIINLSSQVAEDSNELSKGVTGTIIEVVEKVIPQIEIDEKDLNHKIRKNAHFLVYMVLGILLNIALNVSGFTGRKSIVPALGICCVFAIIDEVYQLYVPGRGGQVKDVIIDTAGSVVGTFIYYYFKRCLIRNR